MQPRSADWVMSVSIYLSVNYDRDVEWYSVNPLESLSPVNSSSIAVAVYAGNVRSSSLVEGATQAVFRFYGWD